LPKIKAMRTLPLIILVAAIAASCNQKEAAKENANAAAQSDSITKPVEIIRNWIYIHEAPVPVITEVDQFVFEGKQYYKQKNFKAAAERLDSAASALLLSLENSETKTLEAHKEVHNSANHLKTVSAKLKENNEVSEPELDSALGKVCDASMKHCWLLSKFQEDDSWIPEDEFSAHLDSSYSYFLRRDTFHTNDELAKSAALMDVKKERSTPETRIILQHTSNDIKRLALDLHSKKEVKDPKMRMSIAKNYYDLAYTDYHEAGNELSLGKSERKIGRTVHASSAYLQKALEMANITTSSDEDLMFDSIDLTSEELKTGVKHTKADIEQTLVALNNLLSKYKSDFDAIVI